LRKPSSFAVRLASKTGTIVGHSQYANSISVRFDGNKSSSTFHRDYVELITTADMIEYGGAVSH
jgi:hypothetical protein